MHDDIHTHTTTNKHTSMTTHKHTRTHTYINTSAMGLGTRWKRNFYRASGHRQEREQQRADTRYCAHGDV